MEKIDFRESFAYGAWIVSSNFDTPISYRIYIRVLYPSGSKFAAPSESQPDRPHWFANKHLGDDAGKVFARRTFLGVSEADKWDALERYGVKVNSSFSPTQIPTNTVVDFRQIDKKQAAYFLAKALFEAMMSNKFGDYKKTMRSGDKTLEVDFHKPCVVSAGRDRGIANKMLIGVRRVSTLNSRNQVSFDVFHCLGSSPEN